MKPILLDIPMPIETPRLLLRPPQPGDGVELNQAINESFEALSVWMPWAKERPSVEDSEENVRRAFAKWVLREDLRISIFDKASGKLVGSSGLHRINWELPSFEIGYWVRNSFEGKGYITESTNALTQFAFKQLKAKRVEIRCNSKNERSVTVIKRLGFEYEGCLRSNDTHANSMESRDTVVYSRLNGDGLPQLDVSWQD
ncbi:MAG: GNAT family N-acetyltransferase [Bdellovibrionales bacterium]|jgi:RimJ/RimL family protein N-acetyltransferase|nr:GNAT family N-acetyltransferase [Bdellovibrionales bacterium]